MPDYTVRTNFDKTAALSNVIFGADALILETEINELQDILSDKIQDLIKDKFGDGFYKKDTSILNYSGGALSLSNDKALANGHIVNITDLSLALAEGETAYLDVWVQEVTYADTLKIYGNQQESATVTNNILDPRPEITEETSRRFQIQYNMVKSTGVAGHTYLPIATITGGVAVDERVLSPNLASIQSELDSHIIEADARLTSIESDITNLESQVAASSSSDLSKAISLGGLVY